MSLSKTLDLYLIRRYLWWLLIVSVSLTFLVQLIDSLELLRRASRIDTMSYKTVILLSFMRLPLLFSKIIPFVILFASMLTFWRLAKTNELVILRSAGASVWKIAQPVTLISILIGLVYVLFLNTFAIEMNNKAVSIQARYFGADQSQMEVNKTGLWLRQSASGGKYSIIRAQTVTKNGQILHNATFYQYDSKNRFLKRYDTPLATLSHEKLSTNKQGKKSSGNYWNLSAPITTVIPNQRPFLQQKGSLHIPTSLTPKRLFGTIASATSHFVWQMPAYLRTLKHSGFNTDVVAMRYYTLLSTPLLLVAMTLFALVFSIRSTLRNGTSILLVGGISCGFMLYFLSELVHAIGVSTPVPIVLAAWTPAIVSTLVAISALLYLEEG